MSCVEPKIDPEKMCPRHELDGCPPDWVCEESGVEGLAEYYEYFECYIPWCEGDPPEAV